MLVASDSEVSELTDAVSEFNVSESKVSDSEVSDSELCTRRFETFAVLLVGLAAWAFGLVALGWGFFGWLTFLLR